jgi:hypothetical protein
MAENAADRLERRYQQLVRQERDADFVRQLSTYLTALDAERTVRSIVKRLHDDDEAATDQFNETERELVQEAIDIRRRLAEAAPEIDNSDAPEPNPATHAYGPWMLDSLAKFDRLANNTQRLVFSPLPYYDTSDKTPLATMLIILRGRLRAAQFGDQGGLLEDQDNRRPDLDDFGREIHNLQEKHSHALNRFKEQGRTLPGIADERLRAFVAALENEPLLIDANEDEDELAERLFRRGLQQLGIIGVARSALAGQRLDAGQQEAFRKAIEFLRGEADRLHEEVMAQLMRGGADSLVRRTLVYVGRGSIKLGGIIVVAVISTTVGLLISAYFAKWLPGQNSHTPSTPKHPVPTTTNTRTSTP